MRLATFVRHLQVAAWIVHKATGTSIVQIAAFYRLNCTIASHAVNHMDRERKNDPEARRETDELLRIVSEKLGGLE